MLIDRTVYVSGTMGIDPNTSQIGTQNFHIINTNLSGGVSKMLGIYKERAIIFISYLQVVYQLNILDAGPVSAFTAA